MDMDDDPSRNLRAGQQCPGRSVRSNRAGRFERHERVQVHDGWDIPEDARMLRTELRRERPRSALTRNNSPDVHFDRSINPYRGCEHGCVYCFARPSHAYLGLSPGLDFDSKLILRPGIADVLDAELRKPSYVAAPIAIGTNTDPYQPVESDAGLMRDILRVLQAHAHPVMITTKGSLIERDIDILSDMAGRGLAQVGVSVTTLDAELSRSMEPRVPSPARRLRTIARLSAAGVPVRICASPMIPGLTDHELERILAGGADAGARAASTILLRLPREVAEIFKDWLKDTRPDRYARVMAQVRAVHGGQDYDSSWHRRLHGQGPEARLLRQRFRIACKRLGLNEHLPPLRVDLVKAPLRPGDQMSLFEV